MMRDLIMAIVAVLGLAALAACDDDGDQCDPNQRLYHGLCFAIDAGAPDAPAAAITPPGGPDTPPVPRSGSGG